MAIYRNSLSPKKGYKAHSWLSYEGESVQVRELATKQARALLALDPQNPVGRALLYELLADRAMRNGDETVTNELTELYKTTPAISGSRLAPPSFVLAVMELNASPAARGFRAVDTERAISNLKQAIREQPRFTGSHRLLASLYERDDHLDLAVATISQAIAQVPNEPTLHMQLGHLLRNKATEGGCALDKRSDIQSALEAFQAAEKLAPQFSLAHREIALTYESLGMADLYLFEAQKYDEIAESDDSRLLLADALMAHGKSAEALALYKSLASNASRKANRANIEKMYARALFNIGDWKASIVEWQYFRLWEHRPYFYGWLQEGLAILRVEGHADFIAWMNNFFLGAELTDWEIKLRDYHLGKLTEKALLDSARGTCQKVEAEFYVGFQRWSQGDIAGAKTRFENALSYPNGYALVEYTAARYALDHIAKQ
jgi:tetratricopeptide (TPR) repeat protein